MLSTLLAEARQRATTTNNINIQPPVAIRLMTISESFPIS